MKKAIDAEPGDCYKRDMDNAAIKALETLLKDLGSTGLEIEKKSEYAVTIYGVKAGAPAYATKSKQGHGYSKSLPTAINAAVKAFKETK